MKICLHQHAAGRTLVLLAVVVCAPAVRAQAPDSEWASLPDAGTTFAPAPAPAPLPELAPAPVVSSPPPQLQPLPGRMSTRAEVLARIRPAEQRNEVSMLAAPTLGGLGRRGQSVVLGFPLISIRALFGLGERFDLGLGFDSYYFLMNEPRLVARALLAGSEKWNLGLTFEAGYAFFTQRAARESRGARWLTGRRNINLSPALVGSYQGSGPRAARIFLELRYLLALDTEPYATDPLTGVPPLVVPGHNVLVSGGAELPLSAKTAFVFTLGFAIHGRDIDAPLMPQASLGLVTSL